MLRFIAISLPTLASFCLFFQACTNSDPYAGYSHTPSGYPYQLLKKGDGNNSVQPGDYIVYHETCLKNDTLWYSTEKNGRPRETVYPGLDQVGRPIPPPYEAIQLMNPGDCLVVFQSLDTVSNLPDYLKPEDELAFYIKLLSSMTKDAYQEALNRSAQQDSLIREQTNEIITTYGTSPQALKMQTTESGLSLIIHQPGEMPLIEEGNAVTVQYCGLLADGNTFDSSYKRNKPFRFQVGSGKVIDGWDEGIRYLGPGGKATLIIPAALGYGENGYGSLIPPNATLFFYVEVENVSR